MLHLTPGDPAGLVAGGVEASPEHVEEVRERLGFNDPLFVQYRRWMIGVATLDLGKSLFTNQSVVSSILHALPVTLSLAFFAIVFAVIIAVPLGLIAALRPGTWMDRAVTMVASAGIASPNFAVGIVLVMLFALWQPWFPATGYVELTESVGGWMKHMFLPAIALAVALAAELTRHIRASMRDVLQQDYIRTAIAKGLPPAVVIGKHALKNAAIPVVTVLGLQLQRVLGGAVVIESVFALPGLGALMVRAVFTRDLPMIQGIGLTAAVMVLLINLSVDISYGYLNPRVRVADR